MTITELKDKIKRLRDRPREAMTENLRHQVEATQEHTLALYEISLQIALLREDMAGMGQTLKKELGARPGASVGSSVASSGPF